MTAKVRLRARCIPIIQIRVANKTASTYLQLYGIVCAISAYLTPPKSRSLPHPQNNTCRSPRINLLPQINTLVPALQICYPLRPAAAFCSLGGKGGICRTTTLGRRSRGVTCRGRRAAAQGEVRRFIPDIKYGLRNFHIHSSAQKHITLTHLYFQIRESVQSKLEPWGPDIQLPV